MHRTEGLGYITDAEGRRLFTKGPPNTRLTAAWCNAVQEELAELIEGAGLTLEDSTSESWQQLLAAIHLMGQSVSIPADTDMLVHADVAPIGWTLQTTYDDTTVIITKGLGAGGAEGGTLLGIGTWQQPGHVLAAASIPTHAHVVVMLQGFHGGLATAHYPPRLVAAGATATSSVGGGQSHNHGNTWRPVGRTFILCRKG